MNIFAYEHLNKVNTQYIHDVLAFFNKTAIEICEGQQYDMDFEKRVEVSMDEYMHMITLKTSVLLGASLKLGAMLGGATDGCSGLLYDFGIHLGLAFQLKDDYLDTFGTTAATGKQIGGDILSNKKTYLLSKAFEVANDVQKEKLNALLVRNDAQKVNDMIALYEELGVKESLQQEIVHYSNNALELLEKVPVVGKRKVHLQELASILLNRDK
jgi:geranylgeranyl diphosphate synthase type II